MALVGFPEREESSYRSTIFITSPEKYGVECFEES